MKRLIMILPLVGCIPPEIDEKGPELVEVEFTSDYFDGNTSTLYTEPSMELDPDTMTYTFQLVIHTRDGHKETKAKNKYDSVYVPVTKLDGTLAIPGFEIPPRMTATIDGANDRTFTFTDPIVLPATVMGQVMHAHFQAHDADGLASNIVDADIGLK